MIPITSHRKGIVLAGGTGSRLFPATRGVSKQVLPIYDKPMIYYPVTLLMQAGIREIAIITTPHDAEQFKRVLGDGTQWGIEFTYIQQPKPEGLAQAYILAEKFLNGAASAMVLGDNLFFGDSLDTLVRSASERNNGGTVFGYRVENPKAYGVAAFDADGKLSAIVEKPKIAPSNYAITGMYFLDGTASEKAKKVQPSHRGELEITSLLEMYLHDGTLDIEFMRRGFAWLDTGTHDNLYDAAAFVRTLQTRQGIQIGCPEEVAFRNNWISQPQLVERAEQYANNSYGKYLKQVADHEKNSMNG